MPELTYVIFTALLAYRVVESYSLKTFKLFIGEKSMLDQPCPCKYSSI